MTDYEILNLMFMVISMVVGIILTFIGILVTVLVASSTKKKK
jgi:hypothetical protein